MEINELIKKLNAGCIGVIPTDTIYGLVGLALNKDVVERIYQVKGRNPLKPFIVLIDKMSDLESFGIILDKSKIDLLEKYWPGKLTVILECKDEKFEYLSRGTKSLAFRMPKDNFLMQILKETGPLVAPSANPEALLPAQNYTEAVSYFTDKVDFIYDGGEISGSASTIVRLIDNNFEIVRQGDVKVN